MKATRVSLTVALRLIGSLGNRHFKTFPDHLMIPGKGILRQKKDKSGRVYFVLLHS